MTQISQACVPCLCIERAVTICHLTLSSPWLTRSLPSLRQTHRRPTRPFFSMSFLQSCWQRKSMKKGIFKAFNPRSCLTYLLFLVPVVLPFYFRSSLFLSPATIGPDIRWPANVRILSGRTTDALPFFGLFCPLMFFLATLLLSCRRYI